MADYVEEVAYVTACKPVISSVYELSLEAPGIAARVSPGQFVQIRVKETLDPLLRRPFTVYRQEAGQISLLFRVVGRGTRLLAAKRVGEAVAVLGPLGRGYFIPEHLKVALLVGGGVGVASLFLLARELLNRPVQKVYALIGARSADELLGVEDFRALGSRLEVQPWISRQGLAVALTQLEKEIAVLPAASWQVYACGPPGMMRRMVEWAAMWGAESQVSLEYRMACGIGACQSCTCLKLDSSGKTRYALACKDGPVFPGREVVWDG